jgi:NADH-quinone oxidoreductase subunit N
MPFDAPEIHLTAIAPEIVLTITAFAVLLTGVFIHERYIHVAQPIVASLGLAVAIYWAVASWGPHELQLANMVALDKFSIFVKVVLAAFGLLTVWTARDYLSRERLGDFEFYALLLFSIAGMMLMAASADLIVMFIALETFSIALYVMVGYRREELTSQESAMKYFLLGAFSSGFFLLGIALVYGATGSTQLYGSAETPGILTYLTGSSGLDIGLLLLGMGFLLVGLGFKVAAVPFHMWTPDAYQGAPSPVTGFMAAATKLAAFAAIFRLFDVVMDSLRWEWRPYVIGVAIASMVLGSILALVQEDVKRILAYSSIAHAGFILTGVVAANDGGVSGSLFYLATYGVTTLGAFAIVAALAGRGEHRVRLTDYRGLYHYSPLLASAMTLFLLSLAGVPITAGFVGKLVVFVAATEAGYWWLVVIALAMSAVAAFFYIRIIIVMYMTDREQAPELTASGLGFMNRGVIGIAIASTVFFGLVWGPLIGLAGHATLVAGG